MMSSRGRLALASVEDAAILEALAAFDPVVVGTFPLGLERSDSDVDILCFADDIQTFLSHARLLFGDRPSFSSHRRAADDEQPEAAVVRFTLGDFPVELFAQPIPTSRQRGFQHFEIEHRVLELGGEPLVEQIRAARRDGESVEVAFAEVLGLTGDPYVAGLELGSESDAELSERIDVSLNRATG